MRSRNAYLLLALALAVLALVLGLVFALVIRGGSGSSAGTGPTTSAGEETNVRVYWLRDGKVWPVRRSVDANGEVVNETVSQLLLGPTEQEKAALAATTAIPDDVKSPEIAVSDGVARVKLSGALPHTALGQLAYTLTQFPTIERVEVGGRSYARASFEDVTPTILVESPLASERVASPLRARGTANTFEATFDYELTDATGKVLAKDFVTASSGNGMRGTFEFEAPFRAATSAPGTLTVFEISAANGKRIHAVGIPLELSAS